MTTASPLVHGVHARSAALRQHASLKREEAEQLVQRTERLVRISLDSKEALLARLCLQLEHLARLANDQSNTR